MAQPRTVREIESLINKLAKLPTPEDLDKMPFPDRETFDYSKILQKVGIASFHFTRGCPFVCTYCSNIGIAKVYGQSRYNIRQASPEHSIKEIEESVLAYDKTKSILNNSKPKKVIVVPGKIINIVL